MRYVEFWHKKGTTWKRISNTPEIINEHRQSVGNTDCFTTVQEFYEEFRVKDEEFIADLYFDLDGDREEARQDTVKLVTRLNEIGLTDSDIRIYFSGSKGFHVIVNRYAVGVSPGITLHKELRHVAHAIATEADILRTFDLSVYTKKRMLRLPNSKHSTTGLYKVLLTTEELENGLPKIEEVAAAPKYDRQKTFSVALNHEAAQYYTDKKSEFQEMQSEEQPQHEVQYKNKVTPVCVKHILENGWYNDGDRNKATVQLACYYKAAGYTIQEATDILCEFVERHTTATKDSERNNRLLTTAGVVSTVYMDNDYQFSCKFIRSLHEAYSVGENYRKIPCSGNSCEFIVIPEIKYEALSLPLATCTNAENQGKLVTTKVMVAGKKQTPYVVPRKFQYSCKSAGKCKQGCVLSSAPSNTVVRTLSPKSRELLQMINVGDDNIKGLAKSMSGIYDCKKYSLEYLEYANIEELLVIPMADGINSYNDDGPESKYVLRKIYTVDSMDITENKYYEVTGWVYPHPKNQEGTIVVTSATPLQDKIAKFKLDDEFRQQSLIFQANDQTNVESIQSKLSMILNDLTLNVTHIVERDELLLGALLVMHSVLRLNVSWDSTPIRGWLESIVIGDTGTGKSALVDKLLNYVGLGTKLNAESTSRTGLTYKMEQTSGSGTWFIVWGAWPLADKEFIWVDEASGIPKDEYGQLTLARSSGVLEVKRAVTAETQCRVRALLTSNAPSGKRLADYSYGVQSLRDILNNEDIRRFDFAMFLKMNDVNPDKFTQTVGNERPLIEAEVLRKNILFAWSRKSEQIHFAPGTEKLVMELSSQLSAVYGQATDVPLVSPSDQRNKLIRMAAALAALLHSVDDTGLNLVVTQAHAQYVFSYLKMLYNSKNSGLNYYSKVSIKDEEVTVEKFGQIKVGLAAHTAIQSDVKFNQFIKIFSTQNYFTYTTLEAMLNIDKDDSKILINTLLRAQMVTSAQSGYKKTSKFNSFISKAFEMGITDDDGTDDLF